MLRQDLSISYLAVLSIHILRQETVINVTSWLTPEHHLIFETFKMKSQSYMGHTSGLIVLQLLWLIRYILKYWLNYKIRDPEVVERYTASTVSVPAGFILYMVLYLPTQSVNHYSDVTMSAMASQITDVSIVYSTACSDADENIDIDTYVPSNRAYKIWVRDWGFT